MGYGLSRRLAMSYEDAVARTRSVLKEQGFGVLTEIDVKATLKEKLGVDFKRYVILGACNPPFAYRALQAEEEIGLLLPCNVVVYEPKDGGSVVSAINPLEAMSIVDNLALEGIAGEVGEKLRRALEALSREEDA